MHWYGDLVIESDHREMSQVTVEPPTQAQDFRPLVLMERVAAALAPLAGVRGHVPYLPGRGWPTLPRPRGRTITTHARRRTLADAAGWDAAPLTPMPRGTLPLR